MKNLLMSVVLITALAFVFLACGGDEDEPDPLSVYITGQWTGSPLVANIPAGHDSATFAWDLDTSYAGTAYAPTTETGSSIASPVLGKYKVTVTSGAEVVNAEVIVGPGDLRGTWTANLGSSATSNTERVVISPTKFDLTERTSSGVQAGKLVFEITKWEISSKPSYSNGSSFLSSISSWNNCYKMTGQYTNRANYDSISQATTEVYILVNPDKDRFIRNRTTTGADAGTKWTERLYAKGTSSDEDGDDED